MRKKMFSGITAFIITAGMLPCIPADAADQPALLDVSAFSVMDENLVYIGADYLNPASVLFNDQDKVPASPDKPTVDSEIWKATDRSKNWKPNYQSEFGEDSFYMDLGANYVITGICFLDNNGVQDWKIEDGEPFEWKERGSFTTDQYQTWRGVSFDSPRATRYLRFSTESGDSGVSELALYGYKSSELTEAQIAKTAAKSSGSKKTNLSAGQKIGFNAFIDDPMTAIIGGGNIREYHNFSWLLDSDGKVKFTQGTWGDMDSYYSAMKAQNISIIPCFQASSPVIYGENKPPEIAVKKGDDPTDPESYTIHAQTMYQVAARYGSNPDVDPATLNVAEGSEPKIGMGLLGAAENCNEPNKTWSGKASYYTPYELAAMCSADFDGHEGTIPNAGVKQADPDFKLAMGGMLATASLLDYLSEMKLWFDYHRSDGVFAVDIINVHLGPDTYIPEDSSMVSRIREIQAWMDENAPGTELWISEFEVPMGDCETEGVDNHDNEQYQLRYAQRVARTYLTAIGAGIDRMTKFQLRDEGEGVYYNSGLVTVKGEWNKKLAWYYTACMKNTLMNADFIADESSDGICKFVFSDRTNGDVIYCLWSPTNEDKVIKAYHLDMPMNGSAYLTVPGTYAEGTVTELASGMRSISVEVSETPVFVTVSPAEKQIVNGKGVYIKPESLCLTADQSTEICDLTSAPSDSKLNQFYRMFDEPDSMPSIIYGDTAGLKTPETNVNQSNITCYVTLDQPYILTGFSLFDTYGSGSFEVYDAETDTLLFSSNLGTYMSRNTVMIQDTAPTSCLKIVKGGGDLNEAAIYGYAAPADVPMDVTGDGKFDIQDAVALCRWLKEGSSPQMRDWKKGDCIPDGKLNAADLTIMKRALMKR
ncbi:MAG: dockerin type I repeat-containing protein [Oscillospiraceae bacterium]|nr:dockerin type I repeat-containing protein [Oscillospiraceae bacterium]